LTEKTVFERDGFLNLDHQISFISTVLGYLLVSWTQFMDVSPPRKLVRKQLFNSACHMHTVT